MLILSIFLQLMLIASENRTLVIVGDSLSEGYGVNKKEAYPALLANELPDVTIKPVTESGATTASLLERVPWVLAFKPTHVMIALGGNDGLRNFPPEAVNKQLSKAITQLSKAGVAILVVGMKAPPNLGKKYGKEFEETFKKVAGKFEASYHPFLLEGVAGDPKLNQGDGIHPNSKGHEEISRRMLPVVKKFLAKKANSPKKVKK